VDFTVFFKGERMRRMLAGLTAAAFVVALGAPAFAKEETVKGQIVDQTCYMKDKAANSGKDHKMPAEEKDCAVACAKKGAPMALLTADGKLYQITGDLAANMNEKIVPHVAHTVEITGDVTTKDGKNMIAGSTLKMISR
jgi:hypothetical protein